MPAVLFLRVVIDTNVVFEGLTKQGGAAGLIIDAWLAGFIEVYVSNALAYEYEDVLSRKLSEVRWSQLQSVLGSLLNAAHFTPIYFSWRLTSPDPGDDLVIDCAMNAGAIVVTSNVRDFRSATESLGIRVVTPIQFVVELTSGGTQILQQSQQGVAKRLKVCKKGR
ncbi:MAG: putative toxin-antitoxin system toxin component, PIN family, partial [Phormidesmis priestleyi]